MKATCKTCLFWENLEKPYGDLGDCHRLPPYPHPANPLARRFTSTRNSDWCGEHRGDPYAMERIGQTATVADDLMRRAYTEMLAKGISAVKIVGVDLGEEPKDNGQ